MKERVELNNNGNSIESHCKIFNKNKWETRYIVCRLQNDIEAPMLNIYKCRKDRQKDKVKQCFILQDFVGFERSFALKGKNHTMAFITKSCNIILSFQLPETLLQWEAWFKNIEGQGTTHYMQLLKFSKQSENVEFAHKEVRCHIHEHRLAIVHGIPPETFLYCEVNAAAITTDHKSHRVIIVPYHSLNDEIILSCPTIDIFSRTLEKAHRSLNQNSNKENADGIWLQNPTKKLRNEDSVSHWSDAISGLFNFMHQPSTSINPSDIFSSRMALNNNRTLIKTPTGSQKIRSDSIVDHHSILESNLVSAADHPDKGSLLGEYVNVPLIMKKRCETPCEIIQRKASIMTNPTESQRFSAVSENRFEVGKKQKGRSMMDFSSLTYDDPENRYENWRKAKKFIQAFSPKSQQDLNRGGRGSKKIKKSSSTSALLNDPNEIESAGNLATASSMSEVEDFGPSLNIAMTTPSPILASRDFKNDENVPSGLVRMREEGTLKARGGVNIVLARRLASGVNGSYSKYDGEKTTHIYQPGAKGIDATIEFLNASKPPLEALDLEMEIPDGDAIDNALHRERQKLRLSERRASSISFQKNMNINLPIVQENYNIVVANSVKPTIIHVNTVTKEKELPQTKIFSSSESLSSDARSKISIKKRSDSPPEDVAPSFSQKQASRNILMVKIPGRSFCVASYGTSPQRGANTTQIQHNQLLPTRCEEVQNDATQKGLPKSQLLSSNESLDSHQTTRASSYIKLPVQLNANNSSSTETSSEESGSQPIPNLIPQSFLNGSKIEPCFVDLSRRMSEGQKSVVSEVTPPVKNGGYFRKNNKVRRSQKHLVDNSSFF